MTTPVLPDTPDLDTFGGTFADADAVVDPETELAASYFNRLNANVVAASHTAIRAWVRVTAGIAPSVADHDAVWGDGAGLAPVVARTGSGVYTVTWLTAYDDLQSQAEEHQITIRSASVSVTHSGAARIIQHTLTSASVVTVNVYDAAGVAADCNAFHLSVW
jgi:hypothetical protein